MRRMRTLGLWTLMALLGTRAMAAELLVSAAASLTDALKEAAANFENEKPDTTVTFNFAASGILRAQIEQGAPADVFVSADLKEMGTLEKADLVLAPSHLATGELVLAVPENKTATRKVDDLASDVIKRIGIGSPETVPAGRYTKQALDHLGLWSKVEAKAVYAENVRQVLQYLETGSVDAGFVFRTDAMKGKGIRIAVVLPAGTHEAIIYPIAVVKKSARAALAQSFVDYLLSAVGQKTLAKYGFGPPK